jgi:hypothetical protein
VSEQEEQKREMRGATPMQPDCEDMKGESLYPGEATDLEVVDKIDGEEEDEYEMPRMMLGPVAKDTSLLENTLNLSDSIPDHNHFKTFSSNNSIDMQPFNATSRLKQSVKGSKHVKSKAIPNQSYETLNTLNMQESASLLPYLPERNEQQLFTDPKLLLMLKEDLKRLGERTMRANQQDKENMAPN